MYSDAAAAIGTANRIGVGKLRHVAVRDLWVQHALQKKRFSLYKIPGKQNPADGLTKPRNNILDDVLVSLGFVRKQNT